MRRVVLAGMVGNGLEWYDFALYGYFAPVIGKLFFPEYDHSIQLTATYGVFAAGFIMRPLGAMLFGYLGDRFGRKFSLILSILMMAIPTGLIGLLPTYNSIGVAAPILLTFVRLLQGLSLAGQFSGSIAFIVEHAPIHRRGIAGSTTIMSLCAGMLLGSLTATIFSASLSQASFESWGWRVPFMLGLVIALVGFYIRHHTEESPHYEQARDEGRLSKTPITHAFQGHVMELMRGIGMYMSVTVPFYTLTVFLNGFMLLSKSDGGLGLPDKDAYFISTVSMVLMMVMVPFTAHLTDICGRKRVLMWVSVAYFCSAFPIFFFMSYGGFLHAFIADVAFAAIIAFYIGSVPALLVELFPTSVRYTGMSISYNVAAVIGGMTPMIESWVVSRTHVDIVVALYSYIMLCAFVSFISFIGYHDSYREKLR